MQVILIIQSLNNIKKYLDKVSKFPDVIVVSGTTKDDAVAIISMKEDNSPNKTGHLLSTSTNR